MMIRRKRNTSWRLAAPIVFLITVTCGRSQLSQDTGLIDLKAGDYKGAEAYYRKALTYSTKSPEILSNLGIALEMQGKSTEAIQVFEIALKIKQLPHTYALLAEEKCKTRDLDAARLMLARIVRDYVTDPSSLATIAPCISEIGDPVQSITVFDALLRYHDFPNDLALIQLARSYLKAAQYFLGLLSRSRDSQVYLNAIRNAQEHSSPNARGAFDIAAKSSPYFRSDTDFSAATALLQAHPQDPALLYLVTVLSGEQSIQQIEICEERYPDSPYLVQVRAEMLANQGHEAEAVALYEGLIHAHPELPTLLYDLGMLFRHERQWDRALNVFQTQLARNPGDERGAARVSEALFELGRWKALAEFSSSWVNTSNPPLWAMLDLADAAQNQGNPTKAIEVLVKAEQMHPADRVVHYRLARLYRSNGNAALAEKELKIFLNLARK